MHIWVKGKNHDKEATAQPSRHPSEQPTVCRSTQISETSHRAAWLRLYRKVFDGKNPLRNSTVRPSWEEFFGGRSWTSGSRGDRDALAPKLEQHLRDKLGLQVKVEALS